MHTNMHTPKIYRGGGEYGGYSTPSALHIILALLQQGLEAGMGSERVQLRRYAGEQVFEIPGVGTLGRNGTWSTRETERRVDL
jgi:hypothetical protein